MTLPSLVGGTGITRGIMAIGRRTLMGGLGASALASLLSPGLGLSWMGGRARAQASSGAAKRLLIFFSPNGTVHKHWRPEGEGTAFSFPAGSILEPLQEHQSKLLVLDGIDFKNGNNHEGGMATMLTGGGAETSTAGQSVDQYIAGELPMDTPFPSLELGVGTDAWGGGVQTRMLYAPGGEFVHPDQDPVNVYRRVFGGVASDPGQMDQIMQKKDSVLSLLRGELKDLRNRVGASEHEKLDAHLDALRRMETGLTGSAQSLSCETPPAVMQLSPDAHENFADITKTQIDLMVTALSCGMTRVATLQLSHTVGPHVFSWLGISEGHHSLSHMDDSNTAGVGQFVQAERWISEQFAYLLTQLSSLPEPGADGTMLDHTLVVWAKELADGRLHNNESVPFVLAGGSGVLNMGRYLKLGGVPHQKLLVSICHGMGLSNPTFGDPSFGTGPIAELT